MSFRASRRLSDLGDQAAEKVVEAVEEPDEPEEVEAVALDLTEQDELMKDLVEAAYRLDYQANERRKQATDPFNDEFLTALRETRKQTEDLIQDRLGELVEEAVDSLGSASTTETSEVDQ